MMSVKFLMRINSARISAFMISKLDGAPGIDVKMACLEDELDRDFICSYYLPGFKAFC
jgi:hypothetical protein